MLTVCSQPHLHGGKKIERTKEREREGGEGGRGRELGEK
jgi:hypothetical protein